MSDRAHRRRLVDGFMRSASFRHLARRHCPGNDAEDALQRAAVVALQKLPVGHPDPAAWFGLVLKRECFQLARDQKRHTHLALGGGAVPVEPDDPRQDPAAICEHRDDLARVAEIKPAERQAISDLAAGLSYSEIQEKHGWSFTKVNRCLAEGRERLRALGGAAA